MDRRFFIAFMAGAAAAAAFFFMDLRFIAIFDQDIRLEYSLTINTLLVLKFKQNDTQRKRKKLLDYSSTRPNEEALT